MAPRTAAAISSQAVYSLLQAITVQWFVDSKHNAEERRALASWLEVDEEFVKRRSAQLLRKNPECGNGQGHFSRELRRSAR